MRARYSAFAASLPFPRCHQCCARAAVSAAHLNAVLQLDACGSQQRRLCCTLGIPAGLTLRSLQATKHCSLEHIPAHHKLNMMRGCAKHLHLKSL
jgi:hypothetical protein